MYYIIPNDIRCRLELNEGYFTVRIPMACDSTGIFSLHLKPTIFQFCSFPKKSIHCMNISMSYSYIFVRCVFHWRPS